MTLSTCATLPLILLLSCVSIGAIVTCIDNYVLQDFLADIRSLTLPDWRILIPIVPIGVTAILIISAVTGEVKVKTTTIVKIESCSKQTIACWFCRKEIKYVSQ